MSSINRTASRQSNSHTSQSTVNFLEKIEQEMGIKTVPFTDIPAKSPDLTPMDFCAFGLLKCALSKRRLTTFVDLESCSRGMGQNITPDTTTGIIVMEVTM
ncbi:hypothetical protein AVEN_150909-1 [Araneus ventricosus]|uniref:Uncharacterized protein n=1 Tax=Araneus ventricosus TaxID=182803 RepID=A0A4Y2C8I3_ARAVE|nr:hypothetical protein AVEN_150909-1 [Araneus ventricosus]